MDLTALPVVSGGATGIVAMIVLFILAGKLVPKPTMDQRMADKDEEISRLKDSVAEWKTAYFDERETTKELVGQVGTLMEVGRTTERVIRSLPLAAQSAEGGRDDEMAS